MSHTVVTLSQKVQRSETILASELKNEIVMMDIEEGSYYGMEAPGSRIWELAEKPTTVGEICRVLAAEYEISSEQCQNEVLAFIGELMERKIVVTLED